MKEVLQGKKVILIDDSIVRGTTMKALVTNLKEWSGAKEVHLRIGCPPITSPCFYGIDFFSKLHIHIRFILVINFNWLG